MTIGYLLAVDLVCKATKQTNKPTIVGILTFISKINFMLSLVEHEKCFITSKTGHWPAD